MQHPLRPATKWCQTMQIAVRKGSCIRMGLQWRLVVLLQCKYECTTHTHTHPHTHPQTDTCPEHVKWCANLINNWCQQQQLPVKCLLVLGGVKSFGCGLSSAVLGLRFALSSCFLPFPIYHTHPVAIEHCTLHFFRLLVLLWCVIDLSFQCLQHTQNASNWGKHIIKYLYRA